MNWTEDKNYGYGCNYDVDTFDELPEQIQNDLREWFNSEPNKDDKQRLLKLYIDGNFYAWNCDKYQPEYLDALCDDCRMHSI